MNSKESIQHEMGLRYEVLDAMEKLYKETNTITERALLMNDLAEYRGIIKGLKIAIDLLKT